MGDVKSSFLCPPGSIFNQKYLVCDWWYDFECEHASDLFSFKDTLNREQLESNFNNNNNERDEEFYTNSQLTSSRQESSSFAYQENNSVNDAQDLSLAGTGEGGLGYSRKSNRQYEKTDNSQQNTRVPNQIDHRNTNSTRQLSKISNSHTNNKNDDFRYQTSKNSNNEGNYHQNDNSRNYQQNLNNERNRQIKNENYQSENTNYNNNYQNNNENYNRNYQSRNDNYQNINENIKRKENENYNQNYQNENNRNYQNINENAKQNYQTTKENKNEFINQNSNENRDKLPDLIPRGFAVNYGKNTNFKNQISPNNQQDNFFITTPSVINYLRKDESNIQQENYNIPYQSTENSKNHHHHQDNENNDETIFTIDEEDAFDRQRQLEVDNTILNKKLNFENTDEFNFDYDSESRILSSERPPNNNNNDNNNYYYNYYKDNTNSHFSSLNSKIGENLTKQYNDDRIENSDDFNNGPNSHYRKPDNNLRPPNFSTVNSNLKESANKETAHYSDIIPNSKDNGFFLSSTTGSRSFNQINNEFTTTVRDNSRLKNEKSDLQQNNENHQQNAYDYNAQSHYQTSSNYENSNQSQAKEY